MDEDHTGGMHHLPEGSADIGIFPVHRPAYTKQSVSRRPVACVATRQALAGHCHLIHRLKTLPSQ